MKECQRKKTSVKKYSLCVVISLSRRDIVMMVMLKVNVRIASTPESWILTKFPILLETRKQMKLCEIVHTITHSIPLVPALATVPRRSATLASEMETRWRRGGLTRLLSRDFLGAPLLVQPCRMGGEF